MLVRRILKAVVKFNRKNLKKKKIAYLSIAATFLDAFV